METIKIAPDMDEIFVNGNTVRTEFNEIDIKFELHENIYKDSYLQKCMQMAIAMASRTHHIKAFLENHFGNNLKSFSAVEIV